MHVAESRVKNKQEVLTTPEPLQRLQVSGLVPGGTPVPPKRETRKGGKVTAVSSK